MVTIMIVTYKTGEIISPNSLVIIDVRMTVLVRRNLKQSLVKLSISSEKYCSVKIIPVNTFNPNSLVHRVIFSPLPCFFKSQLNNIIAP